MLLYSTEFVQKIKLIKYWAQQLLIIDEAHNFGAEFEKFTK